jgi:hypothetical protein
MKKAELLKTKKMVASLPPIPEFSSQNKSQSIIEKSKASKGRDFSKPNINQDNQII